LAEEIKDPTTNEAPTQEAYDAIKLELEAERQRAQGLVAEATGELTERIATLETEAKQKDEQITTYSTDAQALQEKLDLVNKDFEGAKAAYAYALEDFKKLAASSNPLIPPEVIFGTTVEEVKTSLDRANKLVANVQESLLKQAAASAVPAGAPARTGPNTEGMSTIEKINLGLEQAKKKKE
jgi:chromosome segregation ATPase